MSIFGRPPPQVTQRCIAERENLPDRPRATLKQQNRAQPIKRREAAQPCRRNRIDTVSFPSSLISGLPPEIPWRFFAIFYQNVTYEREVSWGKPERAGWFPSQAEAGCSCSESCLF